MHRFLADPLRQVPDEIRIDWRGGGEAAVALLSNSHFLLFLNPPADAG